MTYFAISLTNCQLFRRSGALLSSFLMVTLPYHASLQTYHSFYWFLQLWLFPVFPLEMVPPAFLQQAPKRCGIDLRRLYSLV